MIVAFSPVSDSSFNTDAKLKRTLACLAGARLVVAGATIPYNILVLGP